MKEDLLNITIEDLKRGYRFDSTSQKFCCNLCQQEFYVGEIYTYKNRFFDSKAAIAIHVETEHTSTFDVLTSKDNKYLGLTDNQTTILSLIHSGLSDTEIAKQLEVSPSTIRHQKFMFREKAKQAKTYLAIYELAMNEKATGESLVHIHNTATMVDDRYITTTDESDKIIKTYFSSLSPLRLKEFPAREKKKIIVLKKIVEQFDIVKHYSEVELNEILKRIFDDYPTIRRYLIEYGFMDRTTDCKEYWLK